MSDRHECECEQCQEQGQTATHELHQQMNLLLSRLDEQQRRWYVALESKRIGHGGDVLLSRITGMDVKTIRRGRTELDEGLGTRPTSRVRVEGGGRPSAEKKTRR
jgi:hypothetical protein